MNTLPDPSEEFERGANLGEYLGAITDAVGQLPGQIARAGAGATDDEFVVKLTGDDGQEYEFPANELNLDPNGEASFLAKYKKEAVSVSVGVSVAVVLAAAAALVIRHKGKQD